MDSIQFLNVGALIDIEWRGDKWVLISQKSINLFSTPIAQTIVLDSNYNGALPPFSSSLVEITTTGGNNVISLPEVYGLGIRSVRLVWSEDAPGAPDASSSLRFIGTYGGLYDYTKSYWLPRVGFENPGTFVDMEWDNLLNSWYIKNTNMGSYPIKENGLKSYRYFIDDYSPSQVSIQCGYSPYTYVEVRSRSDLAAGSLTNTLFNASYTQMIDFNVTIDNEDLSWRLTGFSGGFFEDQSGTPIESISFTGSSGGGILTMQFSPARSCWIIVAISNNAVVV